MPFSIDGTGRAVKASVPKLILCALWQSALPFTRQKLRCPEEPKHRTMGYLRYSVSTTFSLK